MTLALFFLLSVLTLTLHTQGVGCGVSTKNMLRPRSQQARQLTPRRGTVVHLGNPGFIVFAFDPTSHADFGAATHSGVGGGTHRRRATFERC